MPANSRLKLIKNKSRTTNETSFTQHIRQSKMNTEIRSLIRYRASRIHLYLCFINTKYTYIVSKVNFFERNAVY